MNIEELKRKAEAATPGPWAVNDDPRINEGAPHLMTKDGYAIADFWGDESGLGLKGNERNAAYIAAANPAAILALIAERDAALGGLGLFMDAVDRPPERNCSCHISPPCNDCVENSGLREAFEYAEEIIANTEKSQ